jgi:hypothetical protein
MTGNAAVALEHLASFKEALLSVAKHYRYFDRKRIVLNWCI